MSLFDVTPDEPAAETWSTHAWWICKEPSCKWCGRPELRETVAAANSFGWDSQALLWIETLPSGYLFTADDMTEAVGAPTNTGVSGAVLRSAQKRRLISAIGYTKATRTTSHGRVLAQWLKN